MEHKANVNDTQSNKLLDLYFEKLTTLSPVDYPGVSAATNCLRLVVAKHENLHPDYLSHTLEFVLDHGNFMLQNTKCAKLLLKLLSLLRETVARIKLHSNLCDLSCFTTKKERIICLFQNLMDSCHQSNVLAEGGKAIMELLTTDILTFSDLEEWQRLAYKSCAVFEKEGSFLELSCLINILLKWGLTTNIMEYLNNTLIGYLKYVYEYNNEKILEEQYIILEVLSCLVTYYNVYHKNNFEHNNITESLEECLPQLCNFMCYPIYRDLSEQLLTHLVYECYCIHLTWPHGKNGMLLEIKMLPDDYQEWPSFNTRIFFALAYLQLKNLPSRCLWTNGVILEAINAYLSVNMLPDRSILKAMIWLYPTITYSNSEIAGVRYKKAILVNTLNRFRSFYGLLAFEPQQVEWLLKDAGILFGKRLLTFWFTFHDDTEILNVFNATEMGCVLVKFLGLFPYSSFASRISYLIGQLKPSPHLQEAIAKILPLCCSRPGIFSQLVLANPAMSSNQDEILYSIKIVSANLIVLTDEEAIQGACAYSMSLLEAVKDKSNALVSFSQFFTAVKFLLATSAFRKDASAVSALTLLVKLVNYQISNNVSTVRSEIPDFMNILQGQGNLNRVTVGLNLLEILLNHNEQSLLIYCPKYLYWNIFHLVLDLLTNEVAVISFKVLKLLLLREPNLSYSLVIPYSLPVSCIPNVNSKNLKSFLAFLTVWLKQTSQIPCVEVPVELQNFLKQLLDDKVKYRARINRLLDMCSDKQDRSSEDVLFSFCDLHM